MDASPPLVIGVDIGGTKIDAGIVDAEANVLGRARRSTPVQRGGGEILRAVAELVDELSDGGSNRIAAVGVGAPGVVEPATGSVISATDIVPGWQGVQVRRELRQRVGLPVSVDNDVRAMSYGEARLGAGRDRERVLYVSVGTGLGGALSHAGRLVHGNQGTAGEIAHLLVPAEGALPCGCGRLDHLEAVAAGPAIAATYAHRTGRSGVEMTDVVHRMRFGDEQARAVVVEAAGLLGRTLSGLVTALDVDALVVGGGVARIGGELFEPLSAALNAETIPEWRDTPVLPTRLGTDAPILGAALLALDHTNHGVHE